MPTRKQMLSRLDRIPEHLRAAARKALDSSTLSSFSCRPACSPPPGGSLPPWWEEEGGYWAWHVERAPLEVLRELAKGPRYLKLTAEVRRRLRARLGWTAEDLARAREH